MERHTESFCGIDLFTYADYDDIETDEIYFYNVSFCSPTFMREYNGMNVSRFMDGRMKIWNGEEVVWDGFVTDIPGFVYRLNQKTLENLYKNTLKCSN